MRVCGKRRFPLPGQRIVEVPVYYNIILCLPLINRGSGPYSVCFQTQQIVRQPFAELFQQGLYPGEELSCLMFYSLVESIAGLPDNEHEKTHPYWMRISKQTLSAPSKAQFYLLLPVIRDS